MSESSFLNPARAVAAAKIHNGMKVADFGSGSGFFTRAAARAVGSLGVIYAVDVHRDMLNHVKTLAAAEGLHNVEVVAGDVEDRGGSGLPDGSVDAVIATNLFFCAEDKDALVEEIWRVLKPRGRALIIDWSDSFGGLGPHPTHVMEQQSVRRLFERGAFTYVEDIPAGAYHWGFLMRKK